MYTLWERTNRCGSEKYYIEILKNKVSYWVSTGPILDMSQIEIYQKDDKWKYYGMGQGIWDGIREVKSVDSDSEGGEGWCSCLDWK